MKMIWGKIWVRMCINTRKRAKKNYEINSKVKRPMRKQRKVFVTSKKDLVRGATCWFSYSLYWDFNQCLECATLVLIYLVKSLDNKTTNKNFVNESYLFTQISYILKTYTTTAREPSIHIPIEKTKN